MSNLFAVDLKSAGGKSTSKITECNSMDDLNSYINGAFRQLGFGNKNTDNQNHARINAVNSVIILPNKKQN